MTHAPVARAGVPATERQIDFVHELLREVHGDHAESVFRDEDDRGTFDDRRATSGLIDTLMAARKAARKAAGPRRDPMTDIDTGYYATEYQGVLRFYRVSEGKGRWEGRRWLNRFRSDELGRVSRPEQVAVAESIKADPMGCQMRFAAETVRCYTCGRRLTDEASRVRGQGPDCAGLR